MRNDIAGVMMGFVVSTANKGPMAPLELVCRMVTLFNRMISSSASNSLEVQPKMSVAISCALFTGCSSWTHRGAGPFKLGGTSRYIALSVICRDRASVKIWAALRVLSGEGPAPVTAPISDTQDVVLNVC